MSDTCKHEKMPEINPQTGQYACVNCGTRMVLNRHDTWIPIDKASVADVNRDDEATRKYLLKTRMGRTEYLEEQGANARQVGGSHYGGGALQHWDLVNIFGWDYFQGQITKYLMRWRKKNGLEDLRKAAHFLQKYIELIEKAPGQTPNNPMVLQPGEQPPIGVRYIRYDHAYNPTPLVEDAGIRPPGVVVGSDDPIDGSHNREGWGKGRCTAEYTGLRCILQQGHTEQHVAETPGARWNWPDKPVRPMGAR